MTFPKSFQKKDLLYLILIFAALGVLFFDLFTLREGFVSGDHREQQFPWAFFLQQELYQFSLPWWTRHIQNGFPLLAEGQIGAFYPLNWIFLLLFPIKAAYNYGILFHYFLGGVLFYSYLRHSKVSSTASFFASLIFLFGSTQGGYFYYNYISQKVVIWLPLTLILVDRIFSKQKWLDAFFLSLVFAFQVFGGYLQVAIYSIFYTTLYFLFFWASERKSKPIFLYGVTALLTLLFSLPQLLPTYELALFSSRADAMKGIAYLGSMTPLGWLTLFYPCWDAFLRSELYIGLLGLFFFIYSFQKPFNPKKIFFIFATFVFLLLALGKYSPLYVAIIELTNFHGFRTPIKFLFFAGFSMMALAAFGFDAFFEQIKKGALPKGTAKRLCGIFKWLIALMIALPPLLWGFLQMFRPQLLNFLQRYVTDHIFNTPGHAHSLETYMGKAVSYYDSVIHMVSLGNRYTFPEWLLLSVVLIVVILLTRKKQSKLHVWKYVCCGILLIDLFFYGTNSIRPNFGPLENFDLSGKKSKILQELQLDKSLYRAMHLYSNPEQSEKFSTLPSLNMLYGIDVLEAYSPLVMKRYKQFLEGWGYSNDSLSVNYVDKASLLEHLDIISLLNVKYIISTETIQHPDLILIVEEEGVFLYRNKRVVGRAFFVPGVDVPPSKSQILKSEFEEVPIHRYHHESIEIRFNSSQKGILILSDVNYPKWVAAVDGEKQEMLYWEGLFKAIKLSPGNHHITFQYRPIRYQRAAWLAFFSALGFFFLFALIDRKRGA